LRVHNNYIFCISSKNPTHHLIDNIELLYQLYTNPVIHVIDSDSVQVAVYKEVELKYPNVVIHYIKNKNYELGAWKYVSENIIASNYVCIQDTLFLKKKIDFDFDLYDVYYFECRCGFTHCEKESIFQQLKYLVKDTVYEKYCIDHFKNTSFSISTHTSFAIKGQYLKNIISNFEKLPTCKVHSQLTERIMALTFSFHNYKTRPLPGPDTTALKDMLWSKVHGARV